MTRFLLFTLLYPFLLISQVNEQTKLPVLTPVSPKSYEFLKQGDIAVGKYSGTPNVSIPIYTIESKGLSVPIALSYNSNGFKVTEEASWAGLGWSLDPGGAIIHTINDADDFGQKQVRALPDFSAVLDAQTYNCSICPSGSSILNNCTNTLITSDGKLNNGIRYNLGEPGYYFIHPDFFLLGKDSEVDVFRFRMPGYSGEFLLNWNTGKFVCLTDNKIKIEGDNSPGAPYNFTIMVAEGHKFTFQLKETTTIISSYSTSEYGAPGATGNENGNVTSRSYQLIKISTNCGDEILYTYHTTQPVKNLPNISKSCVRYIQSMLSQGQFPPEMSDNFTSYNYTQQQYSYISSIKFNGGIIDFGLSDRTDVNGAKKVDFINIKNGTASTGFTNIKSFNFTYGYFTGHENGTNLDNYLIVDGIPVKNSTELKTRLKLESFSENGDKPYLFEYNAQQLPKKTALATDYWGYYNGVLINSDILPNAYALGYPRDKVAYANNENNNKGSKLEYTRASLLEKIIYPTGGFTTFEYELNTFENNAAQIPPFIAFSNKNIQIHSRLYNSLPNEQAVIVNNDFTQFTGSAYLSKRGCTTADLPGGASSNIYIKIQVFKKELIQVVQNSGNYNVYGLRYVLASLGLLNGSNQNLYNQYISQTIYLQKDAATQEDILNNLSYTFNKGIIVFTAVGGCGTVYNTENNSQAFLNLSYKDYNPINLTEEGAGVRIKTVSSYTLNESLALKKRYTYSGGKLMDGLLFFTQLLIPTWAWWQPGGTEGFQGEAMGFRYELSSNSFIPTTSSNFVGYDTIDEWFESSQQNQTIGRISETYLNEPHAGALSVVKAPGIKSITNGLLAKKDIYNSQNVLLSSERNSYKTTQLDCFYSARFTKTGVRREWIAQTEYLFQIYTIGLFPVSASYTSLTKSSVLNFYGSNQLITTKDFEYNYFNQITHVTENSSNQDLKETLYLYPLDLASTNSVATQMLQSNVLAPVLTRVDKINNEVISTEEKVYYKRLGSNNNFTLQDIYSMSKYRYSKGSNSLEDRLLYNSYDALGNPLDVSIPGGSHTSYIWGYNKRYPIAKIENIQYQQIPSNLIIDAILAADTGDEALLHNALTSLRTNLSFSLVSTFTYRPLIGVGSITDAKGYKITYTYDSQGRLQKVTDPVGNILSENEYHYKN